MAPPWRGDRARSCSGIATDAYRLADVAFCLATRTTTTTLRHDAHKCLYDILSSTLQAAAKPHTLLHIMANARVHKLIRTESGKPYQIWEREAAKWDLHVGE
jgi:hypothetical protein